MRTTTWTQSDCPAAIAELRPAIRSLALGYANAHLAAGQPEERALTLGIARAFATDAIELPPDGGAMYVHPVDDHWIIFSDADEDTLTFNTLEDAARRGAELAHAGHLPLVVLTADGAILETRDVVAVPHSENILHVQHTVTGWVLRGPNGQIPFPDKWAAVTAARAASVNIGADVIIHHDDGSVADYQGVY